MTIAVYEISIVPFTRMLKTLRRLLDLGETYAAENGLDPAAVIQTRLHPDMMPFSMQVALACNHARNSSARIAGVAAPDFPDRQASFDDLRERIDHALAFLATIDPALLEAGIEREVHPMMRGQPRSFPARRYLIHIAMPNFYFHVTTAYVILRQIGVPIGKPDYLEAVPFD